MRGGGAGGGEGRRWGGCLCGGGVPIFFSGPKSPPRCGHLSASGKKKEHKPKLLGPDIFRWGGCLPHEREGAKKLGTSFERDPGKPNFWAGYPGIFAGMHA